MVVKADFLDGNNGMAGRIYRIAEHMNNHIVAFRIPIQKPTKPWDDTIEYDA